MATKTTENTKKLAVLLASFLLLFIFFLPLVSATQHQNIESSQVVFQSQGLPQLSFFIMSIFSKPLAISLDDSNVGSNDQLNGNLIAPIDRTKCLNNENIVRVKFDIYDSTGRTAQSTSAKSEPISCASNIAVSLRFWVTLYNLPSGNYNIKASILDESGQDVTLHDSAEGAGFTVSGDPTAPPQCTSVCGDWSACEQNAGDAAPHQQRTCQKLSGDGKSCLNLLETRACEVSIDDEAGGSSSGSNGAFGGMGNLQTLGIIAALLIVGYFIFRKFLR